MQAAGIFASNRLPNIREDQFRIDRIKLAGTIGGHTIFRFFEPHRIKRRVRLVETANQAFYQRRAALDDSASA